MSLFILCHSVVLRVLVTDQVTASELNWTIFRVKLRSDRQNNNRKQSSQNRSVFSLLRTPTTWHCPHSAVQQSTDITCPPGPQQQARTSRFAAVGSCWDRQTSYCYRDPAPHTMRHCQ